MKKYTVFLFLVLLSGMLFLSCNENGGEIVETEGDTSTESSIEVSEPETEIPIQPALPDTETTVLPPVPDTEAEGEDEPALRYPDAPRWENVIAVESRTIEGGFTESVRWAEAFLAEQYPGFAHGEPEFVRGAVTYALADDYEVCYNIWEAVGERESKRICTIEFVREDDRRPAFVFEATVTELHLRDICAILNDEARFDGSFTYPEPESTEGYTVLNLSEAYKKLEGEYEGYTFEVISEEIMRSPYGFEVFFRGENGGEPIVTCMLVSDDGSMTGVDPSREFIDTPTLGTVSPDGISVREMEDALWVRNLHTGEDKLVYEATGLDENGEVNDIQTLRVPSFWRFDDEGRVLYHIRGWEHYWGLGIYDPVSGENETIECDGAFAYAGGYIYTESHYATEFAMRRLHKADGEWISEEIKVPDYPYGTWTEHPGLLFYHNGERLAALINYGDGTSELCLYEVDGTELVPQAVHKFESGITYPTRMFMNTGVIYLEGAEYAMCDEYAFLVAVG